MANRNQIRIIAGKWRGRRIPVLDKEGLRPTSDSNRETVFNWLQNDLAGKRVLDLFAGSGALGLEALSRGAAFVTFIEFDKAVAESLRRTLQELDATEVTQVITMDACKFLRQLPLPKVASPFDLIFLDPPFNKGWLDQVLPLLENANCLTPDGIVYLECEKNYQPQFTEGWQNYRQKTQGASQFGLWLRT